MTLAEGADLALVHAAAALRAGVASQGFERIGDDAGRRERAALCVEELRATCRALHAAGVTLRDAPAPDPIPLRQLDTPDTRTLLAGVEALLPIAERIDAARGRALDRPVAGSAGLDLAEELAQLAARLQLEIHGPGERVTGGRE